MLTAFQIIDHLRQSNIDVNQLLTLASNYIRSTESSEIDYFKSLDHYCRSELPEAFIVQTHPSQFIPPIINSFPRPSRQPHDLGYLLDLYTDNGTLVNQPIDLHYWIGNKVSIFYNPIMIGFYSDQTLFNLGWGSSKVASYIAYLNHRSKPILEGRICVILTRHLSKYAHFVRDRLTKIIWAQFYSGHGPYDHFVFDFPLNASELNLLDSLGIKHSFVWAFTHKIFSLAGDIMIIKCSSGMSLLPYLRDYVINNYQPLSSVKSNYIFLSRGKGGSRRDATNSSDVESLFQDFGFSVVNTAKYSIQQQLSLCINSSVAVGFHGAQLINAFTSSSLIELHSYPYAFSPWAQTMRLMSTTLSIDYIPLLIGFPPNQANIDSSKSIGYVRNIYLSSHDLAPNAGQSDSFGVDLIALKRMIEASLKLLM